MPTAQHWPWRGRWWRTWSLWIAGKKAFWQWKTKTAPLPRGCQIQEDFFSAQPARSRQLPTGRRSVSSRGPHRIVSRLAGDHQLNLLCRPFGAETANGCLVLNRRGTTAERHERELKHLRTLCTRFSEARRESFCPLDTDLSWMSANLPLPRLWKGCP
jgi:hypothetical protein